MGMTYASTFSCIFHQFVFFSPGLSNWGSEAYRSGHRSESLVFPGCQTGRSLFAGPCYIATGGNDGFACVGGLRMGVAILQDTCTPGIGGRAIPWSEILKV